MGQSTQHHRYRFACAVVSVSARGAGAQIWPRLAGASCWINHRLRLGLAAVFVAVVAHARYGHPLRFYITPHFGKCSPVVSLKLHLVSPTASRPYGLPKQALCKVAFAGVGRTAVGASRSHPRPMRRRLRVVVGMGIVASVRRFAHCFGQRPTAVHVVFAPAHPWGLLTSQASPARSARPPPRGLPKPAHLCFGFCYNFCSW